MIEILLGILAGKENYFWCALILHIYYMYVVFRSFPKWLLIAVQRCGK